MNLVKVDFLIKIIDMPVMMNAVMIDGKNSSSRSYDVIIKSINP